MCSSSANFCENTKRRGCEIMNFHCFAAPFFVVVEKIFKKHVQIYSLACIIAAGGQRMSEYDIHITEDRDARVWIADCDKIGLVTEAEMLKYV